MAILFSRVEWDCPILVGGIIRNIIKFGPVVKEEMAFKDISILFSRAEQFVSF